MARRCSAGTEAAARSCRAQLRTQEPQDDEARRLRASVGIQLCERSPCSRLKAQPTHDSSPAARAAQYDVVDTTPFDGVEEKGGLNRVLDMAITD